MITCGRQCSVVMATPPTNQRSRGSNLCSSGLVDVLGQDIDTDSQNTLLNLMFVSAYRLIAQHPRNITVFYTDQVVIHIWQDVAPVVLLGSTTNTPALASLLFKCQHTSWSRGHLNGRWSESASGAALHIRCSLWYFECSKPVHV